MISPRKLISCNHSIGLHKVAGALVAIAMSLPAWSQTNCFVAAGAKYKRDPNLYYAIAKVESGVNQYAMNTSHIFRTGTVDIGTMQINSGNLRNLQKRGITKERLIKEACLNVDVGAEILEEKIARYGNTWEAVGAYNAACTQLKGYACLKARQTYVNKVAREYYKITARIPAARAVVSAPVAQKRRVLRETFEQLQASANNATENLE